MTVIKKKQTKYLYLILLKYLKPNLRESNNESNILGEMICIENEMLHFRHKKGVSKSSKNPFK